MHRHERLQLEQAVAELRGVSRRVGRLIPGANESVRESLVTIQRESEAAIRYYTSLLPGSPGRSIPAIATRVAEAACVPMDGIGLTVPGFSSEQAIGKRQ